MAGGDDDGGLGDRAIAYAEGAVEGVRLATWDLVDALLVSIGVPGGAGPSAGTTGRAAGPAQLADMHEVKRLIARAFVLGWEARGEELGRRGRALGGVADDLRRGKRRRKSR